ncbi:succinate dehydrogenase, cytochrome b556 subunit [Tahibacter amnicola]|uniref:Succinate dehydrogenase cytochrome b556 subunit n=1 Tax=Tahibacter amnicola TaxID=2976241 RepID=A0ABY6B9G0_9GAMM|nr:succinate dehydrogenase, cytochrome b556 subunit [Tahibacter amnicola]UXI66693.1 succinate dehydrogenase, cytochrome b556 subunit [Tahibacter amnicola]
MPQAARPLSPHLQIYRWQIQMVSSILHRAAGIALAFGTILLVCLLGGLAAGPEAYAKVQACAGSLIGQVLLFGWTWSLAYHLLNGLRHLAEDTGWGYRIEQFVRTGWLAVIGSLVLTALVWACVFLRGGAA